MINILVRTVILYIVVLFIIRVMGKGELSKLDPFQVVILFMIAELAALPIETPEISLLSGLTSLLTLLLLQVIFSFLSIKSRKFKDLVSGKATILIEKGKFNVKEMKRLRVTLDDLMEQLRLKNYPSVADIDYAILEANGDLSVIPTPGKSPARRSDLSIPVKQEKLPLLLVADGVLYQGNLKIFAKEESVFKQDLASLGYFDYSSIFLCYSDETSTLHVYPKNQSNPDTQRWDIE